MLKALFRKLPDNSDIFLYVGIASLFYGVRIISIPFSYITLGICFITLATIKAMPAPKRSAE